MALKVFLLLVAVLLGFVSTLADTYPGQRAFNSICQEIVNNVRVDSIHFRELKWRCTWWNCNYSRLEMRETVTREQLCDKLTEQHDRNNLGFLGTSRSIPSVVCQSALLSPAAYSVDNWNTWAGRNCGTWHSTNSVGIVTQTFTNHATWMYASTDGIYTHQIVKRNCENGPVHSDNCLDGWNESGGQEVVVWGWDPKDDSNHHGYQASHVGYPFSYGGARCIVWLTGEEAFLECIRNGRRTSAGFWGYGQWQVKSLSGSC